MLLQSAKKSVVGGVGIGDPAIRGEDQLRVGGGIECLAQNVDPAGKRGMYPTRRAGGGNPGHRGQRDNRDRGGRDMNG